MNRTQTASLTLLSLLTGCTDPSATVSAAQPVTVGGEIVVDTAERPHISVTANGPAAVASNGSIFLVVWGDGRNGGAGEIWATRVSSTGALLDPAGFRVGVQGEFRTPPAVASDGRDFLIAWAGAVARVTAAGAVLGVEASSIGTNYEIVSPDAPPGLAWDGANYWAAWSHGPVFAQRLDALGRARGAPITVSSAAGTRAVIAATSAGATVVWEDLVARDIRMARLSSAGGLLDATPQPVTAVGAQRVGPSIATDGTNYFIAWTARMPSGARLAGGFGALFSPAGALTGPGVQYFSDSLPGPTNYRAAVSYNGTNFVVAHAAAGREVVSRVDRAGALIDTSATSTLLPEGLRASASSSTASLVVSGHRAALYSAAGAPQRDFDAITVGDAHTRPRVAALGDDFMLTWQDKTGADLGGARAARISSAGAVLDAPSLDLEARAVWPGVTSDGAQWVLGWSATTSGETGGFSSLRVTSSGARVGAPVPVSRFLVGRLAAFGGGVHLAVASQIPGATMPNAVSRLRSDGTAVDPLPIAAPGSTVNPDFSAVGYDGRNFLLAYTGNTACSIGAVRIDPAGDLIDASPIRLACSTFGGRIDVAFDGATYLIAWDVNGLATGMPYGAIEMARVRADGTLLDPTPRRLSSATTLQRSPVLGYDGHSFVAAWIDTSRGAGDVVGARVGADGTVLDPTPFVIAASAQVEDDPALAVNRRGQVLVAYSTYDTRLAAQRLRARLVNFAEDAGVLPDAGASPDVVTTPDVAAPLDTGAPDVLVAVDGGDVDASVEDVASAPDAAPLDAAVEVGATVDAPGRDAGPADAPARDVRVVDAAASDDVGIASPPDGGQCDVRGRAGAKSSLGGASAWVLLTLARRRRRKY